MCENMKALFLNMKPYLDKSAVLDIVETKFGLFMVENVGRRTLWLEHSMIESYDDLLCVLMQNLEADVLEAHRLKALDEDTAAELRARALPFFEGLPDRLYAEEQLGIFIAEHLE